MGVGAGPYMYVVVVQKFTFTISSPDEFLYVFSFFIILFCLVPCGRLSWLLVSFWAHVNVVNRIVSFSALTMLPIAIVVQVEQSVRCVRLCVPG